MKTAKDILIFVLLLLALGEWIDRRVEAQAPVAATQTGGGPVSTCTTKAAADPAAFCTGTDDIAGHWPGAAGYVSLKPAGAPITSITYNGATVPVTNGVAAISGPTTATVTGTLTGSVK